MNDNELTLDCSLSGFLVKWEGDPPEGWDGTPMPEHPNCIEIIRFEDGKPPELVYRRQ